MNFHVVPGRKEKRKGNSFFVLASRREEGKKKLERLQQREVCKIFILRAPPGREKKGKGKHSQQGGRRRRGSSIPWTAIWNGDAAEKKKVGNCIVTAEKP